MDGKTNNNENQNNIVNDSTIRFVLTLDQLRLIEKALDMSMVLVLDRVEDEFARELMRTAYLQVYEIFEEGLGD